MNRSERHIKMANLLPTSSTLFLLAFIPACQFEESWDSDEVPRSQPAESSVGDASSGNGDSSDEGDGDGETTRGDGDGETTRGDGDGDGDGETSGDGDGETTRGTETSGDGDGDTSGDGDGETTGDGDGDGETSGDGETAGDGDGDGDTSGDGDGDGETSGDGDDETSGDGDSSDTEDGTACADIETIGVALGTAANFAILAKSGISTVPDSEIVGDIGVSPISSAAITGFSLILDGGGAFSTSSQVMGSVFAADYAEPTPTKMTTAVLDMQFAYTDAASRIPDTTGLGAGDIGGMTLGPGVYNWDSGLLIPTDVTLDGCSTDVWIFQVDQGFTMSSDTSVLLAGGAQAKNVFWQVAGSVDIGTLAHVEGTILTQTMVAMKTDASINGRLLAQTAVTLDSNSVVKPAD